MSGGKGRGPAGVRQSRGTKKENGADPLGVIESRKAEGGELHGKSRGRRSLTRRARVPGAPICKLGRK